MIPLKTEPGPNEYRCDLCRGIFTKTWSDAEALAEKERDFPGVALEHCARICDDCYQKVRPDKHSAELDSYKAEKN